MDSPPELTLGEPLHVIRLHDPRFTALDTTGARTYGGRWNSPGAVVVYAAMSYGGAVLETRVHANVRTPPPREIAVITIPVDVPIAELRAADLPGWDDADQVASRAAGDAWLAAARTVALIVPSPGRCAARTECRAQPCACGRQETPCGVTRCGAVGPASVW